MRIWNFEEKNKTFTSSPSNSLAAPFGSTVMSHMVENRQAALEGGSESPSPVKADWNCLLHILAFSFVSVLRLPFSLSDAIPKASFLRDLTNDQIFLSLLCLPILK